jgi:hypothetical protein
VPHSRSHTRRTAPNARGQALRAGGTQHPPQQRRAAASLHTLHQKTLLRVHWQYAEHSVKARGNRGRGRGRGRGRVVTVGVGATSNAEPGSGCRGHTSAPTQTLHQLRQQHGGLRTVAEQGVVTAAARRVHKAAQHALAHAHIVHCRLQRGWQRGTSRRVGGRVRQRDERLRERLPPRRARSLTACRVSHHGAEQRQLRHASSEMGDVLGGSDAVVAATTTVGAVGRRQHAVHRHERDAERVRRRRDDALSATVAHKEEPLYGVHVVLRRWRGQPRAARSQRASQQRVHLCLQRQRGAAQHRVGVRESSSALQQRSRCLLHISSTNRAQHRNAAADCAEDVHVRSPKSETPPQASLAAAPSTTAPWRHRRLRRRSRRSCRSRSH